MTHELNRDIERKKRGGRTVRRAAPASPGRDEHSAREKFLTASLDLFAERNFASVTIKDIAKALNVNTALIYYYFDSKTDLFRATIEYAVAGAFENVRALDDRSAAPPAIIAAWLANHVNKFAEIHRFVKIALDFRGAHEGDPDIANTIESFYVEERKLLSRVIREGIRQGHVQAGRPQPHGAVHLDLSRRLHGALGHSSRLRSQRRGSRSSSARAGDARLYGEDARQVAAALNLAEPPTSILELMFAGERRRAQGAARALRM